MGLTVMAAISDITRSLAVFHASCYVVLHVLFYALARCYELAMEAGDYSYYCREMVVSRTNFSA
jgi:hypothetical protein